MLQDENLIAGNTSVHYENLRPTMSIYPSVFIKFIERSRHCSPGNIYEDHDYDHHSIVGPLVLALSGFKISAALIIDDFDSV